MVIKNGMNQADIDGVKINVLMQHYQRWYELMGVSFGALTWKDPKKTFLLTLVWKKFEKSEDKKHNEQYKLESLD